MVILIKKLLPIFLILIVIALGLWYLYPNESNIIHHNLYSISNMEYKKAVTIEIKPTEFSTAKERTYITHSVLNTENDTKIILEEVSISDNVNITISLKPNWNFVEGDCLSLFKVINDNNEKVIQYDQTSIKVTDYAHNTIEYEQYSINNNEIGIRLSKSNFFNNGSNIFIILKSLNNLSYKLKFR